MNKMWLFLYFLIVFELIGAMNVKYYTSRISLALKWADEAAELVNNIEEPDKKSLEYKCIVMRLQCAVQELTGDLIGGELFNERFDRALSSPDLVIQQFQSSLMKLSKKRGSPFLVKGVLKRDLLVEQIVCACFRQEVSDYIKKEQSDFVISEKK